MKEEAQKAGRLHPMTVAVRDIAAIFASMGFGIAHGPELEDEFHNFDGLRVAADHPSRDMQDTFWVKDVPHTVMRTHTTAVTMRELERMAKEGKAEMREIFPGKVFRNEATDITHEVQFYQLDGFAAGPVGTITLAHLKNTLESFYREYLGANSKIRFRPSYFPFTEPSVEVDAWFEAPGKEGKWLEMCGGGMIHPGVLEMAGLDPETTAGFAWGGGIERLVMVKYGVPDARLFHNGDARFVYGFDSKEI